MTQQQKEAVAVFDEIASSDELRLDWVLQPGDIQLLHNHQIVHTRSEYEDFEVSFRPVAGPRQHAPIPCKVSLTQG